MRTVRVSPPELISTSLRESRMKKFLLAVSAALVALTSGCATVTTGTTQSVTVETVNAEGASVPGYTCRIVNGKGSWTVTTPGSTTLNKAYSDATVNCEKTGEPSANAVVKSQTKAYTFGNVLVGGLIGVGVDAMSGATWAYPDLWKIILGKSPLVIGGDGKPLEGEPLERALKSSKAEEPKK
jgi:hypothetical protein